MSVHQLEYEGITSEEDYENRWMQRKDMTAGENVLGYGPNKKFRPPLYNPQWMLSIIERHWLLTTHLPLFEWGGVLGAFVNGLMNGDSFDGYFYNSPGAAGQ